MSAPDARFMVRALELARKGCLTCSPNPMVGCVIVNDGIIVGEGWHQRAGEAHAEVHALSMAGQRARGGTAYVTLEPCSHFGRTPPCADALIAAGIRQLVVAMQDPNPMVAGQGCQRLRNAGVDVVCGMLSSDAELLNPGFLRRMRTGLPYVRSKLAMSLDARTGLADGESRWITSAEARRDVHHWRARSQAILTGIGTVLADDPLLTARIPEVSCDQPLRVVLDSHLRMPESAAMLQDHGRVLIITLSDDTERMATLKDRGAEIQRVAPDHQGYPDFLTVMQLLAARGCNEVWCEGGAVLNGSLLRSGLVNEWLFYMAPHVLGDAALPLFKLPVLKSMEERYAFRWREVRQIGPDLCIHAVGEHKVKSSLEDPV